MTETDHVLSCKDKFDQLIPTYLDIVDTRITYNTLA